jgi:hypothetical protein
MAGTAITIGDLIQRTGRENGPDIMLKLDDAIKAFIADGVITPTSNITEVLNVIAYLCNTNRTDANGIDTNSSIDITQSGLHNYNDGLYATANTGNGASAGSLWLDDTNAGPTTQMINLNTLQALACPANHIPVGILTRTGAVLPGSELKGTFAGANNAVTVTAVGNIADEALANFVNCIKQLINIAETTRTIFGPKGWTELFQKVKGGGGTGKTHAKRTHRRHRRRYSSKQY